MINVALEANLRWSVAVEAKVFACSKELTIANNMAKDFPSPMSSANMPPAISSGATLFAPVVIC
jgi:hypothetical protein